eukprot:TRINITY_DN7679_c0_g1_i1.p2 TRINITY_DN7679_c0_g1~~TRINITY_DN7679_c0_g1_i1.p2  ORF type:complete len:148 (+),score=31.40 TRINITY_DN7679_c0_g1_i1:265-708(+)
MDRIVRALCGSDDNSYSSCWHFDCNYCGEHGPCAPCHCWPGMCNAGSPGDGQSPILPDQCFCLLTFGEDSSHQCRTLCGFCFPLWIVFWLISIALEIVFGVVILLAIIIIILTLLFGAIVSLPLILILGPFFYINGWCDCLQEDNDL